MCTLAWILAFRKWVTPAVCCSLRDWHLWRDLDQTHSSHRLNLFADRHLRWKSFLLHLIDRLGLEKKFGGHVVVMLLLVVMLAANTRNIVGCRLRLHSTSAGHALPEHLGWCSLRILRLNHHTWLLTSANTAITVRWTNWAILTWLRASNRIIFELLLGVLIYEASVILVGVIRN